MRRPELGREGHRISARRKIREPEAGFSPGICASNSPPSYGVQLVLGNLPVESIAMNAKHLGGSALIPARVFQHALDEFLLEFRESLFQQNSAVDHQPYHLFQLLFHVITLRRRGCLSQNFKAAPPQARGKKCQSAAPPKKQLGGDGVKSTECVAGNPLVGFSVLVLRARNDIRGQLRPGRQFVPPDPFQIIPHVLFVEGWLSFSRHVLIRWPEP
jgi:hypothetical protein